MLFFALLGFCKGFFNPSGGHKFVEKKSSPLFFRNPAALGGRQRSRFACAGVAAHSLFVPTMKQAHVDIELVENAGNRLIDYIVQSLRTMVERRDRREDNRAH